MTISQQLRKAIDDSELSRYRIAKMADVEQSVISRFMAGSGLTTESLDRLASALNLELKSKGGK